MASSLYLGPVFGRCLMSSRFSCLLFLASTCSLFGFASAGAADEPSSVSFGRDVRPILAKHCFTCHGPDPDARQAGLRLDSAETAYEDLGGYAAIAPGDPEASELLRRVTSDDEGMRMPPAESGPPLSDAETETLRRWIAGGAAYERHWSFVPPEKPSVPEVSQQDWCRGEIDRFVLARLEQSDLKPAPRADRLSLVRRLYLDLVGLTPSPEEVDRFVGDDDPKAYRRLVDHLLASPEYAERFARPWLDLARYSDTNGYEKDRPRTIWPFRDWVIRALAADMPFDQFSIEQLAGDMLPEANAEQRIATGFHRNTMINEEGGIDPNEYRYHAIVDRVATTGTVWMGLTTGCAQCHTHKYDPITHTDYYSLFALLNQADEPDVIVPDQQREAERQQIEAEIDSELTRLVEKFLTRPELPESETSEAEHPDGTIAAAFEQWLASQKQQTRRWRTIAPAAMDSTLPKLTLLHDDSVLASGDVTKRDVYRLRFDGNWDSVTALKLEVMPHPSLPDGGPGMAFYEGRRGDFFLSELSVVLDGKRQTLEKASHSYGNISVGSGSADAANVIDGDGSTGWSTSGQEGQANRLVVNFSEPLSDSGPLEVTLLFERHFAAALGRFRVSVTNDEREAVAMSIPEELQRRLADHKLSGDAHLPVPLLKQLQREFVRVAPELSQHRRRLERLRASLPERVRTLGMRERSAADQRVTHRHHRGEYLQPKEVVEPAVPALFEPLDTDRPADRLALARWLVSERNPLVGRVTVNRGWRAFFGTGIVDTAGDFGTQSEPPSHPELLDWLAIDLQQNGWSLKRLHRQIVLSATYQQAIGDPPAIDPNNRLLSVFPYHRLDAERIRDALLSAAGLLSREIGGPSVYPPQPEVVMQMAYGSPNWDTSQGGDRYRRSLYTFSKRTAPFAAYSTFDAPSGENCIARRDQSTTPLQALTVLNDEMFLELARGLAETAVRESGSDATAERIAAHMFRRLLVRSPGPDELEAIVDFYHDQADQSEPWVLVARALINTDEAITIP